MGVKAGSPEWDTGTPTIRQCSCSGCHPQCLWMRPLRSSHPTESLLYGGLIHCRHGLGNGSMSREEQFIKGKGMVTLQPPASKGNTHQGFISAPAQAFQAPWAKSICLSSDAEKESKQSLSKGVVGKRSSEVRGAFKLCSGRLQGLILPFTFSLVILFSACGQWLGFPRTLHPLLGLRICLSLKF